MDLLVDTELERSAVVANNRMNRERNAVGVNSYQRELGFNPLKFLADRITHNGEASWLDLWCGRGRALIEAAHALSPPDQGANIVLLGVDLVFDGHLLGADDGAGTNYSGQEAVDSYYDL